MEWFSIIYWVLFLGIFVLFLGVPLLFYYGAVNDATKNFLKWFFGIGFIYLTACFLGVYILKQFTMFADMNSVNRFYIVAPLLIVLFGIIHMLQYKKDNRTLYSGIFIITQLSELNFTPNSLNSLGLSPKKYL